MAATRPNRELAFIDSLKSEIQSYINQNNKWLWKNVHRARHYLIEIDKLSQTELDETIFKKVAVDFLLTARKEGPLSNSTELRDYIGNALRSRLPQFNEKSFEIEVRSQLISTGWTVAQSESGVRFNLTSALLKHHGYEIPHAIALTVFAKQAP